MDHGNIVELLDAHDKVPTKREAVEFKKNMGPNFSWRVQRDKAQEFFHNPDLTTNLKVVDEALKGIIDEAWSGPTKCTFWENAF